MKTDLPSPKPDRRKLLALRFAVLIVAASVLGAAYWFTRPPELVWWRSPQIGNSRRHFQILIPQGWVVNLPQDLEPATEDTWQANYWMCPDYDRRPTLVRLIMQTPNRRESAILRISVLNYRTQDPSWEEVTTDIIRSEHTRHRLGAERFVMLKNARIWLRVYYERTSLPAFNRTYRQISNSLRIE